MHLDIFLCFKDIQCFIGRKTNPVYKTLLSRVKNIHTLYLTLMLRENGILPCMENHEIYPCAEYEQTIQQNPNTFLSLRHCHSV